MIQQISQRQLLAEVEITEGPKARKNFIDLSATYFFHLYLTNPANYGHIKSNIIERKGIGDIDQVPGLVSELNRTADATVRQNLQHQLEAVLKSIPNLTHPDVVHYGDHPKKIDLIGSKRTFDFKPKSFEELCNHLNILRTTELGNLNGSRSYYLMNELAKMEQALVRYTVDQLRPKGFELISVPEILPPEVIERCGMKTEMRSNPQKFRKFLKV